MASVFEYRAPTDEDKVHFSAMQDAFLDAEKAITRYRAGDIDRPRLERELHGVAEVVRTHVPDCHERSNAAMRLRRCFVLLRDDGGPTDEDEWTDLIDALRECRMWANAGIVLAV